MATRVVIFPKDDLSKILVKGLSRPIENAQSFFGALAAKQLQQIGVTFKFQGRRAGNEKWTDFGNGQGVEYYRNKKTGKFAKRYGTGPTDTTLRYNKQSRLLEATSGFKESFTMIKTDKRRSIVGTKLKLAKDIMSNPERQVLFVNPSDYILYKKMFCNFLDLGIKF